MGFAYLNIHPVSTDINIRGNVFFEEGQLQEKYKPEDVQAEALPLSSYNEQNVIIIQSGFRRMKARKEAEQQKEQLEYTKPKNENIQPYRNRRILLLAYGDDNYNKIADKKSRLLTPYVQYQLISAIRRQRKLIYSDGSIYEGYFSQDYQHSYGRLIMHLEIFKYIMMLSPQQGDFQNGKRTNKYADVKGRIQKEYTKWFWQRNKADEMKYEGSYENGVKYRIGRFQWTDGSVYEGSVGNDQMEGFGTLCGLIRGNVKEIGKI